MLNFAACGLWEMLAQTLSRLSPTQAGPLALGTLKLQHWYDWESRECHDNGWGTLETGKPDVTMGRVGEQPGGMGRY